MTSDGTPNPVGTPRGDRRGKLAIGLAVAFPVLLLFFATYFYGGEIGFWSDDYWHNQRDPVTQELPGTLGGLVIDRGFFLRPLFYIVVPVITTLAWKSEWAAHLILVLAHFGVVVLLWKLMLRLRLSKPAAGAAALLFMVYPIQFEVVMWLSALPTALATIMMLVMFHLYTSHASGRGWASSWWMIWQFPMLAFGVCSLNEQPAMGILVMPALYVVAVLGSEKARERTILRHGARCLLPPLFAGLAVLLYLFLVKKGIPGLGIHPAPAGTRGAADTLVPLERLPERAREFARSLWPRIWMKNFAKGAFLHGWSEVRGAGVFAWLWLALVTATGLFWVRRWAGLGGAPAEGTRGRTVAIGAAAVLFGLLLYVVGFLPPTLVAIYLADSRLLYWPSIGAAVAVAGFGTIVGAAAGAGLPAKLVRTGVGVVILATLLFWAVAYVGIQSAFKNRWEMDHDEGRQLRALLPAPPPLTFFVPIRVESAAVRTGSPVFDVHHRSVWEFPWTVPKFIQTVYQRDDVRCGYWRNWLTDSPVRGADERGIHFTDRLGPLFEPIPGSGSRVIWERAVPFVVGKDGRVRLVTHVVITERGEADEVIEVPQAGGQPMLELRLPRG